MNLKYNKVIKKNIISNMRNSVKYLKFVKS